MKKVLVAGMVLVMASVASADLIVNVEQTATFSGLTQYTVYLVASEPAYRASSFDGRFDGPMNQVWVAGIIATPDMKDIALLGDDGPKDTHVLLWAAQMAVAKPPNEDGPGTGTYLASEVLDPDPPYGIIDVVTMAIGIKGDYQADNLAFAQIVIPTGAQVHMTGNIGRRDQEEGIVADLWIPEPATVGLLALGGLGLILRRRRRS